MKKLLRHPLTEALLLRLLALYGKLVFATARVRLVGPLPPALSTQQVVIALWHQHIAHTPALVPYLRHPLLALMSGSADGRAMRILAAPFGITAAVGSSHRGALTGTRGLLRAAQTGHNLFITPDGPRGPARIAKPGAAEVAKLTGLPLVPCAAWSARGHNFGSWDALRLPYPFTTLYIAFGAPLQAAATPAQLQQALNTLTAQAQAAANALAQSHPTH